MIKFRLIFLLSFLLMFSNRLSSQTHLTGYVYNAVDSTAIPAASVYFDGTSTGVSTTDNGYFRISLEDETTSPLVVSSLGYETIYIPRTSQQAVQPLRIFMNESEESLGEVYLETDPWSRKKKLDIFRKEFLGRSPAATKCKIQNEDALQLTYIPSREILIASAKEPLIVVNRYLGYEIIYELGDFRVEFSTGSSNLQFTHIIYYEGTSFFRELKKNPTRRFLQNREKVYRGSTLEFMRSLAGKRLSENSYRIFKKNFEIPPYEAFRFNLENGLTGIELKEENINILHREIDQSSLQAKGGFFIDRLGNHTPPQNVIFSGDMGNQRFAETLPLNYSTTN